MTVELLIRLTDDGHVTVTGPIDNKLLVLGLLDFARDVVKAHRRVIVPNDGLVLPHPPQAG